MPPFLKFLPLKKFPLQLLYMKLDRENSIYSGLRIPHVSSTVITNRSVISSLTFYAACPFIRFLDLQIPFRWSLNIKKMKLENGGESIMNWAPLVHEAARKKTLRINNLCVTFLYFNIPCGFYYSSLMQVH